jgi:hypothetical protein
MALRLLRVAAVRRLPDHEIAAEEIASLRDPHDEMVVGLAARGRRLDGQVPEPRPPRGIDEHRRPIEVRREARRRQAELALVDVGVPLSCSRS